MSLFISSRGRPLTFFGNFYPFDPTGADVLLMPAGRVPESSKSKPVIISSPFPSIHEPAETSSSPIQSSLVRPDGLTRRAARKFASPPSAKKAPEGCE